MQISKQLMDVFYERDRAALKEKKYELSFAWSNCESMVNNLHHGRPLVEWLTQFRNIVVDWRDEAADDELRAAYDEALEFVDIAMPS